MRKIKVLNIISHMSDGGAQRIVLNYARYFKNDEDIDFKVLAIDKKKNAYCENEFKKLNLKIIYVNNLLSKILIKLFGKKCEKYFIKKALKKINPDVVHVHISGLLSSVFEPIDELKIPVRFDTLHSNPFRYTGSTLAIIKKSFNEGRFIPICLNELQANQAKEHYRISKFEIVPNGINFDKIDSKIITKKDARKIFNYSDNDFVIGSVGRLNKVKNYEFLIKIFSEVLKVKSNAKLVFAGEGEEKNNLEKLAEKLKISDKVSFLGNIDKTTEFYCMLDTFVLCSHSEAFSLVLLEAQRCKTYCVISNGVPDESIVTNHVKKINENDSAEVWAKALISKNFNGTKVKDYSDYELTKSCDIIKEVYLKYWKEYKNE